MDLCRIWKDESSYGDQVIWLVLVVLPILFGPVLAFTLEIFIHLVESFSKQSCVDTSTRPQQRWIVASFSVLMTTTYSTNLILAEKYLHDWLQLSQLNALLCKYFLGSLELTLAPCLICLVDTEIRQGIVFLYRRKRARPGTGHLR